MRWSDTEIKFLQDYSNLMTAGEIARKLGNGRTAAGVKSKALKLGIKRDNHHMWTEQEIAILKENYGKMSAENVGKLLGLKVHVVYNKAHALGLKTDFSVTAHFNKGIRRNPAGEFKKGQTPWNKGLKGIHHGSSTSFKKGHLPQNTLYDGAVTVRTDTSGLKYKYIRLSKGVWRELHRVMWEEAHGPVPKSHVVRFVNGDTLDCRLDNLQLITRAEHAELNTGNRESDNYIAGLMSPNNPELRAELKKHPEILELKRKSNQLNKEIKNASK